MTYEVRRCKECYKTGKHKIRPVRDGSLWVCEKLMSKYVKIKLKVSCSDCSKREKCTAKRDCLWCSDHNRENNDTRIFKEK